jgi:arylsulfatase A-like enzyme
MDAGIGSILAQLETMGVTDETLVFFTSDNGMNMGHHGICGKGNGTLPINMFETSVKVPAIIAGPRVAGDTHGPPCVASEIVNHYDWMPTLLDYLGIEHDDPSLPGRSFLPLLEGRALEESPAVAFDEYGPTRMIRRGRYKYVHRYPGGPYEFYDLETDPDEKDDRYHDGDLRDTIRELRTELTAWFDRYARPEIDGSRLSVSGRGQMGPADEKPPAPGPKAAEIPFAQFWHAESGLV